MILRKYCVRSCCYFFYEISDKTSLKAVLPPYLKFKKPGKTSKARYWRRYCQLPFKYLWQRVGKSCFQHVPKFAYRAIILWLNIGKRQKPQNLSLLEKCCKSCVWYTAYVVNKNVVKANFSCLKKVVFEVHQFRVTIALNFVNGLIKILF
jgi:hypothetical protein